MRHVLKVSAQQPFGEYFQFNANETPASVRIDGLIEPKAHPILMGWRELLEIAHLSKSGHGPFSSMKGQVAILDFVIQMATDLLAVDHADLFHVDA